MEPSGVCQRSSNHKLKAIHNCETLRQILVFGVSKIVKSQIESNSQLAKLVTLRSRGCVKDRQITNWKQFTTDNHSKCRVLSVCQRSSNHKLKAIHNGSGPSVRLKRGVSKIVKSQIESNSQRNGDNDSRQCRCVKDRQITNWKQFTTVSIQFGM